MPFSRRDFLEVATVLSVAAAYPAVARAANEQTTVKALAFDAFPIFDPRHITHVAISIYGEKGRDLTSMWFSKIFGYMFILSAAGQYQAFADIAKNSLRYTARSMNIAASRSEEESLIGAFYNLPIWPDVVPALKELRAANVKMMFLSNMPTDMLKKNVDQNNLEPYFDSVMGSDAMECYKPSPGAYSKALTALGLSHDEVGFVAFGHWDAIGATWFGYKTAWINRTNGPAEELNAKPQIITNGIEGALLLIK